MNKETKYNVKRTIANSDDLKKYLTKEKLNEFKRQINEFMLIVNEVDKKIININKQTNSTNTVTDINSEFELNVLISALMKS